MWYKVLLFETNSIVSFFQQIRLTDEIRKRSIPSTLSSSELTLKKYVRVVPKFPSIISNIYPVRTISIFCCEIS
jgi:hypothetical protein